MITRTHVAVSVAGPGQPGLRRIDTFQQRTPFGVLHLGGAGQFVGLTFDIHNQRSRLGRERVAQFLEGFPMALCEAMACGMAVVSTRYHDGVNEIVENGVNGLVVPVDDLHAITDAMDALMSDVELRKQLGHAAKRIVDRYGIEPVIQSWQSVLQQAV